METTAELLEAIEDWESYVGQHGMNWQAVEQSVALTRRAADLLRGRQ